MDFSFFWTIHEMHTNKIQQQDVQAEVLYIMFHTLSDIQYLDELQYDWCLQRWQSPQWL